MGQYNIGDRVKMKPLSWLLEQWKNPNYQAIDIMGNVGKYHLINTTKKMKCEF
jgi:hypothetical protein